jgi:spore coat polysaccharide biosynthesis protein SpsF (cytidylyltransferase family)
MDRDEDDQDIRLTIDTPEDLDFFNALYQWDPEIFELPLINLIQRVKQFKLNDKPL